MQGLLEAMAMGRADVGSPSPCPIAWLRQSPEHCSHSGCLKAGPWARMPVPCWGGGACRSPGCMAEFGACFAFTCRCQQDQTRRRALGPMPWLSHGLFLGLHPALPPCTAPREGKGLPESRYLASRLTGRVQPWVSGLLDVSSTPRHAPRWGAEVLGVGSPAGFPLCRPHPSQGGKLQCRVCPGMKLKGQAEPGLGFAFLLLHPHAACAASAARAGCPTLLPAGAGGRCSVNSSSAW